MRSKHMVRSLIVVLVALWGAGVQADRPPWSEYPMECAQEHGVCFHEYTGVSLIGADPASGDLLFATVAGDMNDFAQESPDGTVFLHIIDQSSTDVIYCPGGVMIPDGCWPLAEGAGRASVSGEISLNPDTGAFAAACPFSAHYTGIFESPMGELFRVRFAGIWVPNPNDTCRIVTLEIGIRPTTIVKLGR